MNINIFPVDLQPIIRRLNKLEKNMTISYQQLTEKINELPAAIAKEGEEIKVVVEELKTKISDLETQLGQIPEQDFSAQFATISDSLVALDEISTGLVAVGEPAPETDPIEDVPQG